ncbi:MAG: glycosyltransferase family 2 protein [Candidatus Rokubacteria bacterium]|nr:glycosyltransferase family 2 protein [Candidatus Rokubacteria bacterium]
MSAPTFTAIVLTQNDASQVAECLAGLQWCEERIVVDLQSEDRTRELAEGLATKILVHERIPSFPMARNLGLDAATGDWILVVDTDELIPPKLRDRLHAAVAGAGDVAGIWLPRMNHCFGRPVPHVGGFPDYQLRCFRRGTGRYGHRLHDPVRVEGRTIFLPIEEGAWILHSRTDATIGNLARKWDGYAQTEAQVRLRDEVPFGGPLALLWTPLSTFRHRFFTLKGYRDGLAGLVLSVLFAFYRFEVEAKAWEASGYGAEWDREVARLGSVPRLAWALGREAARRLWKSARRP